MTETMQLLEGIDPTRTVGRRAVAFLLDYLLIGLATAMVWYLADVTIVEQAAVAPGAGVYTYRGPAWQIALVALTPLLYIVGVFVVLQGQRGWTPGKLAVSLRCARWDGRPPGIVKAFLRTATLVVGTVFLGWIWWAVCFVFMAFTKGHRRPGDLLASTFVVDAPYAGRIITVGPHGASAGPYSVYADEVPPEVLDREATTPTAPTSPASGRAASEAARRPMNPVYDKQLDTYVVWDAKAGSLMAFDKKTGAWSPVSEHS